MTLWQIIVTAWLATLTAIVLLAERASRPPSRKRCAGSLDDTPRRHRADAGDTAGLAHKAGTPSGESGPRNLSDEAERYLAIKAAQREAERNW